MTKVPAFLKIESTKCTIKRLQHDPDHEMGAPPGEWVTMAEDVICSFDRTMSTSRRYGGGRDTDTQGEEEQKEFKLITLYDEDILSGDRVIVDGIEYKVDSVILYSTHKEAIIIR